MIFLLSLIFNVSLAAETCDNSFEVKATYAIPGEGYWMQAAGDRYLTYTGTGGNGSMLYDFQERKKVPMTGDVDGAALPEGDLYVHPDPLRFYKLSDTLAKGYDNKPIYTDSQHEGYYQSLGETKKDGDDRTIRILMAENRGTVQDYKIKKTDDNYKIEQTYSRPVPLCRNLDRKHIDFEIPILSRKGNMFATMDQNTGTTKVYSIQMPSGNCTEKADLGVQTDKVSFNFDDSKICYSVQKWSPDGVWRKQLFEFDINTGKKMAVTMEQEDVLYHGYRPDGSLMYTKRNSDPKILDSNLFIIDPPPELSGTEKDAAAIIGNRWAAECHVEIRTPEAAALIGQRLKKSVCTRFIGSIVPYKQKNHAHTAATGNQDVPDDSHLVAFCAAKQNSAKTSNGFQ